MNSLYCILVIYNQSIEDSCSYQFLHKNKNVQLIVYDNSTKEYFNQDKVEQEGHLYLTTHENVGLSKAYNRCLDVIQNINPLMEGFVCILDDDTCLNEEYIQQIEHLDPTYDVYVPRVIDERGILSPCDFQGLVPKRLKELQNSFEKNMSAINSGMVISCRIFQTYRYDERLFLDFVDHHFLLDMHKQNRKIQLLPVSIQQNFSSNSNTKEQALHRFSLYRHDIRVFYQEIYHQSFLYWKTIIKRRCRLMIQYKNLMFLWRK